ncbi:unnamed protein product, partial [Ixodes hexagonus]
MVGRHTDVEFLVDDGSGSPRSFRAHKLVLAMRNEVFETMFYGSLPEGDQVTITDLHPDGFSTFLMYLYSKRATFVDLKLALRIREAAQKYLESKLVKACDRFIRKSIQPTDVCEFLDYGMEHGNLAHFDDLIDTLVADNARQVVESEAFVTASREAVLRILNNPRLSCKDLHVLENVFKWAVAHSGEKPNETHAGRYIPGMTFMHYLAVPFKLLLETSPQYNTGPIILNYFTESNARCILIGIM